MQIGIIGGGSPSMAGLLATMALSGMGTSQSYSGRGFRFVYRNRQDNEFTSQIYPEDTLTTRAEFLQVLRDKEFNYDEQSAIRFSQFKETEQIFKEVI